MGTASQLHFLNTTSTCSPFCYFNFAFPSFWPFLTSTVHKFPDVSSGHDLVGAQIVSKLASNGHDNGHDEVGKCGNYAHLDEGEWKKYFYVTDKPGKQTFQSLDFPRQRHIIVCMGAVRWHNPLLTSDFRYLANLKTKHLLKVRRLADKKQVESPASAEIRHDDGVHWHGRKEGPPWCVEFL